MRFRRVLDPFDRISEIIFGLIMVLTFTATFSAAESNRVEVRAMVLSALACNVAWGIVDAIMYLIGILTERIHDRPHHPHEDTGERPHLHSHDWLAALAIFLLVFLSTFPVVIPFMLIHDPAKAIRASNLVAISMLFICGVQLGRYASWRPLRTGLAIAGIGVGLVGITIALGG